MIQLNDKKGFVIFQKPHSNISYIGIGKWKRENSINSISNAFVLSTFKGELFHLSTAFNPLHENIHIETSHNNTEIPDNKSTYLQNASDIIKKCKNGYFEKCILSRIKQETYHVTDAYEIFKQLCDAYNHGFKYILNHPEFGLWIGVTPEILIQGNSIYYETQALAGSKAKSDNQKWGNKEINEHQYVSDYIREIIKRQGILEYESSSEEYVAGNIKHLNKKFKFKLHTDLNEFINQLHPTPAIAGLPPQKAINWIHENEPHDRELYCGYLGLIGDNNSEIFVNLRCAKIFQNKLNLYVGGGITAQSNPDDEFHETEIKAETLLSVIKKI